jgi:2-polyprenyl-6-methoxyphenol hydroxylase-like FAD-dependent oxidoreductase
MSLTARRALISGASIAGPALAYWLRQYGWDVVVVERAATARTSGQNIDVRGAGREVVRRMGIEDRILTANTGEVGTRFVGADNAAIAEFPAGGGKRDGPTAELEILRGDLSDILLSLTAGEVDYRYGDQIREVHEDDNAVTATFTSGRREEFDVVIAADGMRSRTRTIVVPDAAIKPLGMYTAYLTVARQPDDDNWWRWYNATEGRSISLRPDNVGTIRASLSFISETRGYEDLDEDGQRALLADRFRDAGWAAGRVIEELAAGADFYFEPVGQVHAPAWSLGRVALVGDAAYCASPVSGMGTSLALTGAYVLAGELAAHVHHRDAYTSFERILRPYVTRAQNLPPGTPRLANPSSRAGIAVFHGALRVAASGLARRIAGRLFTPPAEKFRLPGYEHLAVERR